MASKDVIQINKLKIGSSGITGLYVGNTESKYAVMTDSAKTQTVIYDKVKYNFVVNDYSGSVPASGATLNITGTSTKTHGNGVVEQVGFSPTSVTVPANTGSSYSSSVTVTQGTSNLTDAYNYTVAGDAVKSISLTISNPATIPAAGGSVNTCTTAATVTYNSGRQVTSFTPTSVNFNTVSAGTKGTTVSDVTTAGTLTCYIVFGGVTSNTASVYVKQAANAVVSYTGYSDLAGKTISASKVPASGGTSTVSWSGTPSAKRKPVYTSTATGSSVSYTPSISTAVTGNSAVASKGSTISNETTAIATVTGYYWADGLTASTTTSVKQNGNYVTKVEASGYTAPSHFSYSNIGAGATSATPNYHGGSYYTFTSGSRIYDSNNSPSFGGSATYTRSNFSLSASQNGFTAVNSSNGTLTATSLGTTISNARTSANVSAQLVVTYTHASSYSAGGTVTSAAYTSTATCTQNGNYVTSISVSSVGLAYDVIPASGGSKTPTGSNGTVTYTFSSTSTSTTAPASTYGSLTTTPSYAMTASGRFTLKSTSTGEVSATTKGTSVEGITSSDTITKTVNCTWTPTASYNAAGTKTASGTATGKATQAANAVTGYVDYQNPTGKSISGSQVPASGGTSTITWAGTCKQQAKAVYTSNSTASSYTELTISSPSTTVTGNNAVSSKGTTVSNVTTAQTVTGYYWANGKTASTNCYVTQAANAVTNTAYGNVTITSPSNNASLGEIAASGGSKVPTRTATQTITYTFTSTSTSSSTKTTGYSWTTNKAAGASLGSGFYCVNDGSSIPCAISAETRGTTAGDARTSNALTLTCTGEGSKSASVTYYATQAKNEIVSYTDYGTPTGKSISGSQVPAAGGTSTITWSGTPAQTRKPVYTSTATGSSVSFTPTISTAVTGNNAVASKGTTVSNVTTAQTVTGYYWANGKTASTSCYVTQAANAVVSYTDYQTPTGKSISGSQVGAAGGTSTITWSGTAAQNAKPVYTSTSTGSSYVNVAPSVSTAVTGNSAVSSKGTTVSNVTTALTVTGYYWANGKTASTSCYVTQAANAVVSYTDYQTPTGKSLMYSRIPASGGTSTISFVGTAAQNAKPVYTSTATGSSYVNVSPTVSTAITGNSAVASKGTTISNDTTALTATGYYWANGKTASTTCYVTQDGNYVTSIGVATAATVSYNPSTISAAGGTSSPMSSFGAFKFIYSSGSSSTTDPSSSVYGYTMRRAKYTMNNGNGFTIDYTGKVTADSRGTTVGSVRTSNTITYSVEIQWEPYAPYTAGGSPTAQTTATATVSQAANAVTGSGLTNITVSVPSGNLGQIAASGGKKTSSTSASGGVAWTGYTSSASATTQQSYTWAYNKSNGASLGNTFYFINNSTDGLGISATTKGTAQSNATTSNEVTVYAYVNNVNGQSKTGSTTFYATQAANSYSDSWNNPSVSSYSYTNIGAGGGTSSPSVGVSQSGTRTWTSTSTQSITNSSFTYSYSMTTGNGFSINTSTGVITADGRGKTDGNARTSNTATVTVTGAGSKTGTKTATCTQAHNNHSDSWNNVTVSSYSYSNIGAAGGTSSPSVSASQSGTRSWPSGSSEALTGTLTYSYSMTTGNGFSINTSTGVITCDARGKSTATRASNTATVTVSGSGSKSATKTATCTQNGNTYSDSWNNPSVSAYSYSNIGPAGGTSSPSVTATQSGTRTWANSAGTDALSNTSFSYSYSMTTGNGFSINTTSGVITADARGKYATTRVSNTATVTVTGNGKSGTKTATCTQNANTYSDSWNNPTVSSYSYSNIGPAGGTSSPSVSASQSGTRTWGNSAGTDALSNSSFSYSYSMTTGNGFSINTSSGVITADGRGKSTATRASNTATVTVTGNGKSGTKTATCTQNGNTYSDSWNNPTVTSFVYGNTIPAGGGSKTPTSVSASQTGTRTWANSAGTDALSNSSFSYSYAMTASGRFTLKSTSTGEVSATTRGTTQGNAEASPTVTVTATANGKSGTGTATCTQDANNLPTTLTESGTSAYTAAVSIGNGMTAAGGSATVTHSAGHTVYGKRTWSSGSKVDTAYTVSDSSTIAITSNGNSRFSLNGTTLSHSNMTTNATTDTVVVKVTNSSNTSITNTASKSIVNEITNSNYDAQSYTASITIGNGLSAAGGSATVTTSAGHQARYYYTSGSYSALGARTDSATWTITSNGNSRFSQNGNTLNHSSMGTNATTDTVVVKATNSANSSATAQTSTSIVNQITNSNYDAQSYTVNITIGSGIVASGGSATVTTSAGHQARYLYTSGSYTALGARTDSVTVTETVDNNNRYSYSNGTLTHSNMTTNATTDNCTLRATNASNTSTYKDASVSVTNSIVSTVYDGTSGWTGSCGAVMPSGVLATGGTLTITSNTACVVYGRNVYTSGSSGATSYTKTAEITDISPNATDERTGNNIPDSAISLTYNVSNKTVSWGNLKTYGADDEVEFEIEVEFEGGGQYDYPTVYISNMLTTSTYSWLSFYLDGQQYSSGYRITALTQSDAALNGAAHTFTFSSNVLKSGVLESGSNSSTYEVIPPARILFKDGVTPHYYSEGGWFTFGSFTFRYGNNLSAITISYNGSTLPATSKYIRFIGWPNGSSAPTGQTDIRFIASTSTQYTMSVTTDDGNDSTITWPSSANLSLDKHFTAIYSPKSISVSYDLDYNQSYWWEDKGSSSGSASSSANYLQVNLNMIPDEWDKFEASPYIHYRGTNTWENNYYSITSYAYILVDGYTVKTIQLIWTGDGTLSTS